MNMRNHQGCAAGECYEADVAIVGAGIAGATIAYKLASPTCRVLLLDAGPRIDRVTAVNRFKASPTKGNNSPYPVNPYAPDPDDQVPQNFYVQAGPVPFSATSGLRNFRDDPKTRGSTAAFATFILNGYNNPRLGPIELALSAISGANLVGKELATSLSATAAR